MQLSPTDYRISDVHVASVIWLASYLASASLIAQLTLSLFSSLLRSLSDHFGGEKYDARKSIAPVGDRSIDRLPREEKSRQRTTCPSSKSSCSFRGTRAGGRTGGRALGWISVSVDFRDLKSSLHHRCRYSGSKRFQRRRRLSLSDADGAALKCHAALPRRRGADRAAKYRVIQEISILLHCCGDEDDSDNENDDDDDDDYNSHVAESPVRSFLKLDLSPQYKSRKPLSQHLRCY